MKTLEQIKDEVARKKGFSDWKDLLKYQLNLGLISRDMDEAAKLYANAKLEEAAERLKHSDGGRYGCTYGDTEHDSISAYFGYNEAIVDAKQSIINLKDKV